jgi:predicted site-specific integrase-resolvase
MPEQPPEDVMIGAQEAAKMLGVSRSTLYRFVEQGLIRREPKNPLLERAPLRVSLADVERLLREGRPRA